MGGGGGGVPCDSRHWVGINLCRPDEIAATMSHAEYYF